MADFNLVIPVIRRSEGGLSKDPTDTAAKFPVPDNSGYHTNKGITWQTFSTNGVKLGYPVSPKVFYEMPDQIWKSITKKLYWDDIKGDQIKSQAVATILVDWYFGSMSYAIKNLQSVLNTKFGYKLTIDGELGPVTLAALNKVDPAALSSYLAAARVAFIEKISKNPGQSKFRNGWLDDARYTYSQAVKHLPEIGAGLALLTGIFF